MRRGPAAAAAAAAVARLARLVCLVCAACVACVVAGPARAAWAGPTRQAGAERIDDYDVTLALAGDGTLEVTEVIAYDFGTAERHGVYRDIPTRYAVDGDPEHWRVTPLTVLDVSADPAGTPDEWRTEDAPEPGEARIRIGDPDVTVTGAHTYTIRYRVEGVLNAFASHDELYWNAVGHRWGVPIDRVAVRLTGAPSAPTRLGCFAGPVGSTLACDRASQPERQGDDATTVLAAFRHDGLGPYEGLTIVVGFDPGGFVPAPAPILADRWTIRQAFEVTPATLGGAAAVGGLGVAGLVRLGRRGRDRCWRGTPVEGAFGNTTGAVEPVPLMGRADDPVEFVPPEGIRPGQLGTLVDERADLRDVTGTIIDLAIRGHLRIEEDVPEGRRRKRDFTLVRLACDDPLAGYEEVLLALLFGAGTRVTLSALKYTWADDATKVRNALYDDAVGRGWFPRRPDHTRNHWRLLGGLAAVVGAGAVVAMAATTHWALVAAPLPVLGVVLAAMGGRMPHRSPAGTAMVGRVRGFEKLFSLGDEDVRARFAERAGVFTEYLPYAIVFGCADRWARAFEPLGAAAMGAPGWYVGPHPWEPASIADAVDDFSTHATGTLYAVRSSSGSSGFSGGFSGGGSGGGGGGSW